MSYSISVIIPVLNEADHVGRLIEELGMRRDVEIIVVDGGSSDSTQGVLNGFHHIGRIDTVASRGFQLNEGAAVAGGEILWFLHADSRVPQGWREVIEETLNEPGVVAGSFPLRFSTNHWLLNIFGKFSRINHPLFTYGDQGYFMKRSTFRKVGGYRNFPILEDVEIQCRLRKLGRWRKTRSTLTTSARRFTATGIVRQQLRNVGIVSGFLLGVSPFRLSRFYLPEGYDSVRPAAQSASLKPTALSELERRNGRFTRFPFSLRSWSASFWAMLGSLSFKPRAR